MLANEPCQNVCLDNVTKYSFQFFFFVNYGSFFIDDEKEGS